MLQHGRWKSKEDAVATPPPASMPRPLRELKKKNWSTVVHDWAVYKLGGILGSVGHRVKIHKITPAQGKERGDMEIRDYVVLEKPQDGTGLISTSNPLSISTCSFS